MPRKRDWGRPLARITVGRLALMGMDLFSVSNRAFDAPLPAPEPPAPVEAGQVASGATIGPVPATGFQPPRPGPRAPNPVTGLETVIGHDERQRVPDAGGDPWKRICQLDLIGARGTFKGTGWLAGPATIITAGHCVHYPAFFNGWADRIVVAAGRTGDSFPFGTMEATHFSTLNVWVEGQAADHDIAAIHLSEPLGDRTGIFPIRQLADADLVGRMVNVSGYPTDKELAKAQYHHANRIMAVTPRRLFYDIDTVSGQSGAPVWAQDTADSPPVVVGLHAYGVPGTPIDLHITANSAPRFDDAVLAILRDWVRGDCDRLGLAMPAI